jgi:hypothetical protein
MSYYLLILIFAAIFSFYLAIRNERNFQNKLNELEGFRNEMKGFSVRLEKLNNGKREIIEPDKIVFHSSYEFMDYARIKGNNEYITPLCFKDELSLISSSFRYGEEKSKLRRNTAKKKRHNKYSEYSIHLKNYSFA